jgi:hypothetical protein
MPKFEVVLHTKSIFVVEAATRGEALRVCVEGGIVPRRQTTENFEVSQAGTFAYVDNMKDSDDTVAV